MLSEFSTAIGTVKTLSELTALILKIKTSSAVTEKAIESQSAIISLQGSLLQLQDEYQRLLNENTETRAKLKMFEDWESFAARYELVQIDERVYAYALRSKAQRQSEVDHWLCVTCFCQNKKSILQRGQTFTTGSCEIICPRCKTMVEINAF